MMKNAKKLQSLLIWSWIEKIIFNVLRQKSRPLQIRKSLAVNSKPFIPNEVSVKYNIELPINIEEQIFSSDDELNIENIEQQTTKINVKVTKEEENKKHDFKPL